MRAIGLLALAGLASVVSAPGGAQTPPEPLGRPGPGAGPLPKVRLGALLPLTGTAAWYGTQMRQGMALAIAELNRPRRAIPPADRPRLAPGEARKASDTAQRANEEGLPSPGVELALEALDAPALDVHGAANDFKRLAAAGVPVVFTASVTPTLAVYPQAGAQDVLLVHQGLRSPRFPRTSRTLLHTRPPLEARVAALLAYAREHGRRRLALIAAGDEFGKGVRAVMTGRSDAPEASLAHAESVTLDAPDLAARFRRLARLRPDAVVLGFQGPDLGDAASQLRAAGYGGPLLVLDDDPAALLAAAGALDGAALVVDAFVPEPGGASQRFARAYTEKFGEVPSRYAANAYEAVAIVADGLRAARAERGGRVGGTRLRAALAARQRFPSVYGGEVTLRDDGTLARPLALFTVEGEKLVFARYLSPAGGTE